MNDFDMVYRHRFRVSMGEPQADRALLMVKSLEVHEEEIQVEYYLCREFVKFISDHPKLEHLLVSMHDGAGTPLVDLVLSNLELVSDGFEGLILDYGETDLPTLVATYSYMVRQATTPAKSPVEAES